MIYPDTSFLCALYIAQSHSVRAIQFTSRLTEPLPGTSLLFFEFRQSVQFQAFRFTRDRSQGYSPAAAKAAMAALQSDITAGLFRVMPVDWPAVHRTAERLALQHTIKGGHRSFDILHIATALELGANGFLTFDANQKKLAAGEGLQVPV